VNPSLVVLATLLATAAAVADRPSPVVAVAGRFGMAQACAIGPELVITAAHVVDYKPFEASVPAFPVRFEAADGTVGVLEPIALDQVSDLALARPSKPLRHYARLAEKAPEVGDALRWGA
jgi:hypothetical protein